MAERAHKDRNPVIEIAETLKNYIRNFEVTLDEEHEVGARLVSFGQTITFHVTQLGFAKPNIITFYGTTDNGDTVQLIQHVSQLNFLLIAMKKTTDTPKKRIGFITQ